MNWICVIAIAAACGGSPAETHEPGTKAQRGGGQKGAAAKEAGQHVGGHAVNDRSHGEDRGATYAGLTCDEALEGVSWCDSETELAFCAAGEWWLLDCSHPDIDGDVCAEAGATTDCYAVTEL